MNIQLSSAAPIGSAGSQHNCTPISGRYFIYGAPKTWDQKIQDIGKPQDIWKIQDIGKPQDVAWSYYETTNIFHKVTSQSIQHQIIT